MGDTEHWRKLENLYHSAACNEYFGPRMVISEGRAELRLSVRPDMHHPGGAVHGYVYFKVLDDSAFFAVNSLVEDVFVLTAQFNVYFLRPIARGQMQATGQVVQAAPNLYVAESVVVDSKGREIGRGSGSFVRSKIWLTPEVGYKL